MVEVPSLSTSSASRAVAVALSRLPTSVSLITLQPRLLASRYSPPDVSRTVSFARAASPSVYRYSTSRDERPTCRVQPSGAGGAYLRASSVPHYISGREAQMCDESQWLRVFYAGE